VRHQARDEVNVAAEAVQLGHCNRASLAPSIAESSGKLWTAGVSTLARLDLHEDFDQLKAFSSREARQGFALGFNAKTGAALL
jgi:hypothetical protein